MFQGEWMKCFMCGKKQKSDPDVESDWSFIQYADQPGVYVCPGCLQDSPAAQKGDFAAAYDKVLRKILRKAK